jgi:hypothetical protein
VTVLLWLTVIVCAEFALAVAVGKFLARAERAATVEAVRRTWTVPTV